MQFKITSKNNRGNDLKKLSIDKLSNTIISKRKDKKLTQSQLADSTGINRVMISKIENQEYIPSILQLQTLGEVLNFDITDLFIEERKVEKEILNKKI